MLSSYSWDSSQNATPLSTQDGSTALPDALLHPHVAPNTCPLTYYIWDQLLLPGLLTSYCSRWFSQVPFCS